MVLNIPLIEDWKITSDSNNIILQNGEIAEGYFSTIETALEGFLRKQIKGFNSNSMQMLLDDLKIVLIACNQSLAPFKFKIVGGNKEGLK